MPLCVREQAVETRAEVASLFQQADLDAFQRLTGETVDELQTVREVRFAPGHEGEADDQQGASHERQYNPASRSASAAAAVESWTSGGMGKT
jgi:hypothetical protein